MMRSSLNAAHQIGHALKTILLILGFLSASFSTNAQTDPPRPVIIFVMAGDNQGLFDAIGQANMNGRRTIVFLDEGPDGVRSFNFTEPFGDTMNALPVITGNIEFAVPGDLRITFNGGANDFRLAEISGDGSFSLSGINVENFNIDGNGGAVVVMDTSSLICRGTNFRNNSATGEGGAVFLSGQADAFFDRGELTGNRASTVGGAVSITQMSKGVLTDSVLANNTAGVFGCDLNINSNPGALDFALIARGNAFEASCPNVLFENPFGAISFRNNVVSGSGNTADSTAFVQLFGSLFDVQPPSKSVSAKAGCNDFGTGAFNSAGFNLASSDGCFFSQSTDMGNVDLMLSEPDANNIRALNPGSPAIDAAPSSLVDLGQAGLVLPCGYKDVRGLGRPQDANGDGVFECDIGSYEVQGGADIGAAQSGAYFDTSRSGEGVFLEMLGNGLALVAVFTYTSNGDLAWFIGTGEVVGNTVVVDELLITEGGVFGAGFNAENIVRNRVGGFSMVFPNCDSQGAPGRMMFENDPLDGVFEDLLVEGSRLTSILTCDGSPASATSGRSGSFFDADRDGEGIFVQWLPDGRVVVIWYTYTPDGRQFWTISGDVTVSGNTVTASMLYPATGTQFGSSFNPSEVDLQPWGTLTLDYQPGCNTINFAYDSTVPGFGTGNYTYSRLTNLDGTVCDL